jgi:hypothetical protein
MTLGVSRSLKNVVCQDNACGSLALSPLEDWTPFL